jgi:hypothetical protein
MRVAPKHMAMTLAIGALLTGLPSLASQTLGEPFQHVDLADLFAAAEHEGRVGLVRKTKTVDVRPAKPGEIIVTVIKGQGKETQSPPAKLGDFVVRNRCPETGNEEVLIQSEKFALRYEGPIGPGDQDGWRAYQPRGVQMRYFIVRPEDGRFTFTAPWGESMVARPKDAIVRSLTDPKDMYRIAAAAFDCTYEIIERPPSN